MNIYPEDLEVALRAQPEIRDCVVVCLERNGNAEPCAALLARGCAIGLNDPEIAIQRANAALAAHQQIRRWFLWPEPDFPRTSTHKVRANLVREVAQQQLTTPDASAMITAAGQSPLGELIARITRRPQQTLSSDAALEDDLNLSSLDPVELMSALEDRYQVNLDDKTFNEVKTVSELEHALCPSAPQSH